MDAPTADYIRQASRVDFDALDWGEVTPPEIDRLQEELDAILPWIEDVIGYYFGGSLPAGADSRMTPIPARREGEVRKAVRMAVEWEAYKQAPDQIESVIDIEEVQSFTAGSYSETRRGGRVGPGIVALESQVHPWPTLNRLLMSLRAPYLHNTGEVPVVGVSDPRVRGGTDIMTANRWPHYSPYDMRNRHIILKPPAVFEPVNEGDIQITGLPNG